MDKWIKRFSVELYNNDDIEIKNYVFEKKSEQLEKYWNLINRGYKKSQVVKKTITRLEDCGA